MANRVLLCDDEPHILRAAEFKFKRAGFDVVCACNGEEGWEEIQRQLPDIVVTDCQMPKLGGLGLAKRIRQHPETSRLPVIMLTAKGFELSSAEVRENYGILMVVAKPFSPRELLRRVEEALSESPDAEPSAIA